MPTRPLVYDTRAMEEFPPHSFIFPVPLALLLMIHERGDFPAHFFRFFVIVFVKPRSRREARGG